MKDSTVSTIIFCHYGNTYYLKYTLTCARHFNPRARIILIGDDENKEETLKQNVEHFNFNELPITNELSTFEKEYKHIAGENHGREFWTQFVFKRWFYIHSFINVQNINNFWHFDSDNLIFTNLLKHESYLNHYDCTEQCQGICMNGYISNKEVVNGYVNKINELFSDEVFLQKQIEEFKINKNFAFTEMRAYNEYKQSSKIKSIQLNSFQQNGYFDECICNADNFLSYKGKINNYNLKKIFFDRNCNIYGFNELNQKFIRYNSLNMSWVPKEVHKKIYDLILRKKSKNLFHLFKIKRLVLLRIP